MAFHFTGIFIFSLKYKVISKLTKFLSVVVVIGAGEGVMVVVVGEVVLVVVAVVGVVGGEVVVVPVVVGAGVVVIVMDFESVR